MELRAIRWIGYLTAFLTNRTQIVVNESNSCWSYLVITFLVASPRDQWLLDAILFSLCINDFPDSLQNQLTLCAHNYWYSGIDQITQDSRLIGDKG